MDGTGSRLSRFGAGVRNVFTPQSRGGAPGSSGRVGPTLDDTADKTRKRLYARGSLANSALYMKRQKKRILAAIATILVLMAIGLIAVIIVGACSLSPLSPRRSHLRSILSSLTTESTLPAATLTPLTKHMHIPPSPAGAVFIARAEACRYPSYQYTETFIYQIDLNRTQLTKVTNAEGKVIRIEGPKIDLLELTQAFGTYELIADDDPALTEVKFTVRTLALFVLLLPANTY
jgi:hypothetical protein